MGTIKSNNNSKKNYKYPSIRKFNNLYEQVMNQLRIQFNKDNKVINNKIDENFAENFEKKNTDNSKNYQMKLDIQSIKDKIASIINNNYHKDNSEENDNNI